MQNQLFFPQFSHEFGFFLHDDQFPLMDDSNAVGDFLGFLRRQIEAARRAITRHMKRQGRVWIRIFPDLPVSAKPTEVRMGSGKGSVDFWAARVHPGRIMFEIDGVEEEIAREALRLGAMKLPIMTRVVTRIPD